MTSRGTTRGLASTAIAALAVAGLPLLAGAAHAEPLANSAPGADQVSFVAPASTGVSAKDDGTNTTVSLLALGGANVTSVQFQYQTTADAAPVNIGQPVSRNADGAFALDFTPTFPTGAVSVTFSAVPNTGTANTATSSGQFVLPNNAADTVDLGTEGALGVFQSPYAADNGAQWVAVRGTTSNATGSVTVTPVGPNTAAFASSTFTAKDADGSGAGTTGTFSGPVNIKGYKYSAGSEPNQLALRAATSGAGATDDAEASTLYTQTISGITATPAATNIPTGSSTSVTVKIVDQQGKPVVGASVNYNTPGAKPNDPPVETPANAKPTDADGKVTFDGLKGGTYTFYVNRDADVTQQNAGDLAAAPITIGEYNPQNTTLKAAASKTAYDIDEIGANDFTATLTDQNGNPVGGQAVQARWSYTAPGATTSSVVQDWADAGTTDAKGQVSVPFQTASEKLGTYTLEVRRPNDANGQGLLVGTPVSVTVSESEITWADGDSANAPVNGSGTFTGKLALTTGAKEALGGRTVTIDLTQGLTVGDQPATFSQKQPAGTTRVSDTQVTAVTAPDGTFSVSLTDPNVPSNVQPSKETDTLTAHADALKGDTRGTKDSTTPTADATDALTVVFDKAPTVSSIALTTKVLSPIANGGAAPGAPVEVSAVVKGDNGTPNDTSDDVVLKDQPVTVSVDKGFLTPDSSTVDGLTLAPGHDKAGDLWGFFKNDGTSENLTTGDTGAAGAVAAIERDAGFDDDGLVDLTVTVTSGGVSKQQTITFDSGQAINLPTLSLERSANSPQGPATTDQKVRFNLFAKDQFGNLVGGKEASVSDDTPDADVTTDGDFGKTLTDFLNSNAAIVASSDQDAVQTVSARVIGADKTTVQVSNGQTSHLSGTETEKTDAAPITWTKAAPPATKSYIHLQLKALSRNKVDIVKINANDSAAGQTATVYRFGKKIGTVLLDANGNGKLKVKDKNGNRKTKYTVKVAASPTTYGATKSIRIR